MSCSVRFLALQCLCVPVHVLQRLSRSLTWQLSAHVCLYEHRAALAARFLSSEVVLSGFGCGPRRHGLSVLDWAYMGSSTSMRSTVRLGSTLRTRFRHLQQRIKCPALRQVGKFSQCVEHLLLSRDLQTVCCATGVLGKRSQRATKGSFRTRRQPL